MTHPIIIEIRGGSFEAVTPVNAKVRIVDWDNLNREGISCPRCGDTTIHADMSTLGEWFICGGCNNGFYFGHYMEENQ